MSEAPIPEHGVTHGTRDGEEVATVTVVHTYAGDVDDVWSALTDPERLPRWFAPVHGDLRVGGRYQVEGNAGGEITACEPPRRFASTWEMGGFVSWLEVAVASAAEGTTSVTLAHTVATDNDHWRQYGPSAVGIGWDLSVHGLRMHLRHEQVPVDPAAAHAWSTSPEGVAFIRGCGEAWYRADVESGTDDADARSRADLSVAFYTAALDAIGDAPS
jgi:uncharacterized protein YndB with AHSA1/START domain